MFSKQAKTPTKSDGAVAPAGEAPVRKAPCVASLVCEDMTIEGGVSGDGELYVDGVVRGDIQVSRLTVGETGHIEGSVSAETVEVRGRIIGSVSAQQVRLAGTAYVDGDITQEQLTIDPGAFFQGRSLKFQRPAAPRAAAPTAEAEADTIVALEAKIAAQGR